MTESLKRRLIGGALQVEVEKSGLVLELEALEKRLQDASKVCARSRRALVRARFCRL